MAGKKVLSSRHNRHRPRRPRQCPSPLPPTRGQPGGLLSLTSTAGNKAYRRQLRQTLRLAGCSPLLLPSLGMGSGRTGQSASQAP